MSREEFIDKYILLNTIKNSVFSMDPESGEIFKFKIADNSEDLCCSIDKTDLVTEVNIIDICFNKDCTAYYIITPEYKKSLKNRGAFEWIGEKVSKYRNNDNFSNFGYGYGVSELKKYYIKN